MGMIIQFCGLSGSGKTTLATQVKQVLNDQDIRIEILDGDAYRKTICAGLGFSKAHRNENIRRLARIAHGFSGQHTIAIICAVNPYDDVRLEIADNYPNVKTIYIDCHLDVLIQRDTKGLYRRALLPQEHPEKIGNLTGVNDPFDIPANPDLIIKTDMESIDVSVQKLVAFIRSTYKTS